MFYRLCLAIKSPLPVSVSSHLGIGLFQQGHPQLLPISTSWQGTGPDGPFRWPNDINDALAIQNAA